MVSEIHIPVLKNEVLKYLEPKPNENFIDCTIGEAGHALAILERISPNGKLLGIEWDPELYRKLAEKCSKCHFEQRVILVNDSYTNLKKIVERERFESVSGILFDLGLSGWHLEESGRGFSFLRNESLDMRYNRNSKLTAKEIINNWLEEELEKILKGYGEERFAKGITKEIIISRKFNPIRTTFQLVEIIKKATPIWYQHRKIHFATKTFQALRIAVNDELNNLKEALPQALEILERGGRLVIISFHSLEDRIVKNFVKNQAKKGLLKILTKKPIRPTQKEVEINPRSRSARLRAGQKL